MHMRKSKIILVLTAIVSSLFFVGCGGNGKMNFTGKVDNKTGLKYSDESSFELKKFKGQETGPGLVFIVGGTFILGGGEKDIEYSNDNKERQVTIASFYMDETEVTNNQYRWFLYYVLKDSGQEQYDKLVPDTTVWLRDLAFNDPYAQYYFSHSGFNEYPVVGVNWHQANEYAKWRSSKVNEARLEKNADAVLLPVYRLPTEAEWEYAARGGLSQENYPWQGKSLRDAKGKFMANFKRGRGDYAGWAASPGGLNDGYMITAPVLAFYPNDYGLYNMAGNVAEWTKDAYRLLSYEDVDDMNPLRRKGKTQIFNDYALDDDQYDQGRSILFNIDNYQTTSGNSNFDNVKVYRGGSWNDLAYWLTCGSRRYMYADSSTATIGFRCAMTRVGSPF